MSSPGLHLHGDTPVAPPPRSDIVALVNDESITTLDVDYEAGSSISHPARGVTMDDFRTHLGEEAAIRWMTRQNVDNKLKLPAPSGLTTPADLASQRKALRDIWLASLRAQAHIEFFNDSSAPLVPPVEE